MNDQLAEAFEICLSAMQGGASREECLEMFPHLSSELEPLLTTAALAGQMRPSRVPARAAHRSRALFLKKARDLERRPTFPFAGWGLPRLAMAAFSLLLVVFLSLNGLIVASAKTLPGDALYVVKRATETVRLQLVSNTEIKHRMENDYNLRRATEVKQLLVLQRSEHVSFEGRVEQIHGQQWIVEGILIKTNEKTHQIGHIQPGDFIEVEGLTNPSGWIDADELHQRYFNLVGVIQSMNRNTWVVGDVNLVIQKDTQFDPGLQIGDQALVLVYSSDDGKLYARAILNHQPTPYQPFQIQFTGLIEGIDGQAIIIDGKRVEIDGRTVLEGALMPGAQAEVVLLVAQDGTLTALSVRVVDQPLEPAPVTNPGPSGKSNEIADDDQHNDSTGREKESGEDMDDDQDSRQDDGDSGDNMDDDDDGDDDGEDENDGDDGDHENDDDDDEDEDDDDEKDDEDEEDKDD